MHIFSLGTDNVSLLCEVAACNVANEGL